jgi:hypothetical protein
MEDEQSELVATLHAKGGVTPAKVQEELQSIWDFLRKNPDARKEAEKAGVPPAMLDAVDANPFIAGRGEEQFVIAATVVVIVGKAALGWATKKALDVLWDRVVFPRLEKHFGADLEQRRNAN